MKKWYSASTSGNQGLIVEDDTGRNVAVTYDKADAALIAAAPAMLEALHTVRELRRAVPNFNGQPVAWVSFDEAVDAAINAAEGKE